MKSALAILISLAFIGLAVFGAFAMSLDMENCIAESVNASTCPLNNFASFGFHLDAFKKFSTGLAEQGSSGLILILSALFGLFSFAKISSIPKPNPQFYFALSRFSKFAAPPSLALMSWLSLYENSPSFH